MLVLFSIVRSIANLILFRLHFPDKYHGKTVQMPDGLKFKIFRHMKLTTEKISETGSIFIVRFKFNKFSHKANIRLSRIPILMIAGFSGFNDKLWMIDWKTGYWQGVYQWENEDIIEKYKKSFVLGLMNKRAEKDSLSYKTIPGQNIDDYLLSLML